MLHHWGEGKVEGFFITKVVLVPPLLEEETRVTEAPLLLN